jgi:hypothetical protein
MDIIFWNISSSGCSLVSNSCSYFNTLLFSKGLIFSMSCFQSKTRAYILLPHLVVVSDRVSVIRATVSAVCAIKQIITNK